MATFGRLLAQQSSPAEVLVFLALSVALFLTIALLLYVVLIAMLRPGLSKQIPLRRILLPSSQQLRDNLGDYALVVLTSLLLSLTLSEKAGFVEQVANYKIEAVESEQINALFEIEPSGALASRLARESLEEIVQPIVKAGRIEEASILVESVISEIEQDHPRWLTARRLVIACCLLALLYLGWLARRRFRTLRERPESAPDYSSTFRSLLTLGLCTGLLLASAVPLAEGNEHLLRNSALAAIAHDSGAPTSPIRDEIADEIRTQRQIVRTLIERTTRVEEKSENAAELAVELEDHLQSSERRDAIVQGALASLQSTVTNLQEQLAQSKADNRGLEDRVAALGLDWAASQRRLAQMEVDASTGARQVARLESAFTESIARLAALESNSVEQAKRVATVEDIARGTARCCRNGEQQIGDLTRRQQEDRDRLGMEAQARREALRNVDKQLTEIKRKLEGVQCCNTVD